MIVVAFTCMILLYCNVAVEALVGMKKTPFLCFFMFNTFFFFFFFLNLNISTCGGASYEGNPTAQKAHFVGPGSRENPRLSQTLTRGLGSYEGVWRARTLVATLAAPGPYRPAPHLGDFMFNTPNLLDKRTR